MTLNQICRVTLLNKVKDEFLKKINILLLLFENYLYLRALLINESIKIKLYLCYENSI